MGLGDFFAEIKKDRHFAKAGPGHTLGESSSKNENAAEAAAAAAEKRRQNKPNNATAQSLKEKKKLQEEQKPETVKKTPEHKKPISNEQNNKNISPAAAAAIARQEKMKEQNNKKPKSTVHGILATDNFQKAKNNSKNTNSNNNNTSDLKLTPLDPPEKPKEKPKPIELDPQDPDFLRRLSLDLPKNAAFQMTQFNEEEIWKEGFTTLLKYLNNIVKNWEEAKYRKIKMSNKTFNGKVSNVNGMHEFLELIGFETTEENISGIAEKFYILPQNISQNKFSNALVPLIDPPRAPVHRKKKLYSPSENATCEWKIPSEFFIVTQDDARMRYEHLKDKAEKEYTMRTQAMREAEKPPKKVYQLTSIRIRFPDNSILEGTFRVHEPISRVLGFINCNLDFENENEEKQIYSLTMTGSNNCINNNSNETLCDLDLVPRALLNLMWLDKEVPFISDLLKQRSSLD